MKTSKNVIKINESQLKQMISESIKNILNEVYGQYQQPNYISSVDDDINDIKNSAQRKIIFDDNMKCFANAYKIVANEYSIISSLKRKGGIGEIARDILNVKSFLKYIMFEYGEELYITNFGEEYQSECEEAADAYLQHCVISLKSPNLDVKSLYEKLGLNIPFNYRK